MSDANVSVARAIISCGSPARLEETHMAAATDRPVVRVMVQCRRCPNWLHSPASVAAGIGRTCAAHERAERRASAARELTLFDIAA
ncbi:DUF6011 domain-containing protein [Nocardia sp. 852002-20019_SCH5090214]|uniref:DUF6011 domain-containing protein n=1 Tax=Nocardia sp. 852002-20019_SCH5090214 TaxID=1834087 RepID=UPI000AFA2B26|nr:DUF6011 domain-containing protein [Nocardia sp. 852002-20019_SCH5090214]